MVVGNLIRQIDIVTGSLHPLLPLIQKLLMILNGFMLPLLILMCMQLMIQSSQLLPAIWAAHVNIHPLAISILLGVVSLSALLDEIRLSTAASVQSTALFVL